MITSNSPFFIFSCTLSFVRVVPLCPFWPPCLFFDLVLWLYSLAAFVGFLSVDGGNDEFVLSLLIIRLSRSLSFLRRVFSFFN